MTTEIEIIETIDDDIDDPASELYRTSMDKFILAEWIEALRWGTYVQGIGGLRTYNPETKRDEFCCLGVLCDIYDPGLWTEPVGVSNRAWGYKEGRYEKSDSNYAPITLINMAAQEKLSNMNDSGDYDFNLIADWIEHHIKSTE